jgi:flagellar hook-associated protein 1 FlgK
MLLDQLSTMGNITVTKSKNANGSYTGAIDVKLGTNTIVDENGAFNLSNSDITSSTVTGGSLAALVHLGGSGDSADTLQYYVDKLNTLAVGIAESVNTIHKTGTNLNEESDTDFFVFKDADGNIITAESDFSAENIYVNPDVEDDVSKIAASKKEAGLFLEGNGDTAREIADLKDTLMESSTLTKPTSGTGVITIGAFYVNMATELGSQVNESDANVKSQRTLVDNLSTKKESISGVSLDEETANTVLYQHAYSACAQIISTLDEMLDTIINKMKA